jgi:catechol 2,3-dioxygenase-like lactoylglutathione lyase family enzyme
LGLEDEAPPALDHVQVAAPAGCEARARWFYGALLGLDEVEKPPPLARRGGVWFALASGAQLHVGAVSEGFAPALKAHPGLRIGTVARLEMLGRRLAAVGARVEWDSSLPGVSRFFTADPFGNRLELLARKA